jgi:glycosyltransferase involved in cell wall biosynthesis
LITVPSVTVGIPFRNAESTLPEAIASVFAQEHEDWELVLVDDGSTDRSGQLAGQVRDPRVFVINDGRQLGLSARLNQIAAQARGKYLARMDADDLMSPERLGTQLRWLLKNDDVDVLATGAYVMDEARRVWGVTGLGALDLTPRLAVRGPRILHPSVMARTVWFRNNPYDSAFWRSEDRELWCRTCDTSRFARVPEPLMFYRVPLRLDVGNYRCGSMFERKIARRYGFARLGRAETLVLIAQSYFKQCLSEAAVAAGQDAWLIRRRYPAVSPALLQEGADRLHRVISTPVPGLGEMPARDHGPLPA